MRARLWHDTRAQWAMHARALESVVSDETPTAAPYREDPREAEIARLKKALEASEKNVREWRTNYEERVERDKRDTAALEAKHREAIDRAGYGHVVRTFGKVVMALLTLFWFAANVTGLLAPAYFVVRWRVTPDVLWLTALAVCSWVVFYVHTVSLSEARS